jgi:hypothetical protein
VPKELRRVIAPSLVRFEGFPYLITRVVSALYHVILLPTPLSYSGLRMLALRQTLANRLDTCLVLADNHAVYFDARGDSWESGTPPAGGSVLSGQLLPAVDFLESEDMRTRREQLEAFAAESGASGGCLMGDLTKGGRAATEEEIRRLAGHAVPRNLD